MRRGLRHWVVVGLGWIFLVLGVAGLFLPFLQGILFLAIGAAILAGESARVRLTVRRLRRRYPKLGVVLDRARLAVAAVRRRLRPRRPDGR